MVLCIRRRSIRKAIPPTPEPVEGRIHTDIQTDSYLEELVDVVPEADMSTQTDPFIDRPPTPLFIPQKSGVDAVTQIIEGGYMTNQSISFTFSSSRQVWIVRLYFSH